LLNADLLDAVLDCADGFEPPPKGFNGGTGLYCGEQDMFMFLIDPTGWTEIGGESFAPGFFLWNSEVGRRSLGVETFWFQSVCSNHIVWDAIEVVEFSRKHTANVHDGLVEVRRIIQSLALKRDQRRDAFAKAIRRAMDTTIGEDADEVRAALSKVGISRTLGSQAIEIARQQGRFTVFSMVDALTRLSRQIVNAGDRTIVDQQAGKLLTLAA
jgi:histone H3/H4